MPSVAAAVAAAQRPNTELADEEECDSYLDMGTSAGIVASSAPYALDLGRQPVVSGAEQPAEASAFASASGLVALLAGNELAGALSRAYERDIDALHSNVVVVVVVVAAAAVVAVDAAELAVEVG